MSLFSKGYYFCHISNEVDEKTFREDARAFFRSAIERILLKKSFQSKLENIQTSLSTFEPVAGK